MRQALLARLGELRLPPAIRALWVGLVLAATFLLVQPRLWDDQHFLGWDIVQQAWPNLVYIVNSLADGVIPLWNPFEKAGYSFIADPEAALLYPLTWLLGALSRLWESGPQIMLVQLLLHVMVAASGTYLCIRRLDLPPAAGWFGAGTYVLSARFFKSKDQTVLGSSAWFPWMMIAVEEIIRRPSWRSGVMLGTVVGVDFLAGYPPNVLRNVLALAVIFLFELVQSLRSHAGGRAYAWRLGRALGTAVAVAVGLTAPVILAVGDVYPESKRTVLTLHEIIGTTLHPGDLLQMISPALQQSNGLPLPYIGLAPLFFVIVALTQPSSRRLLWAALAGVFFLLGCGKHAFLLPALVAAFPFLRAFRIPEQNLFIFAFFCALLAARGLGDAMLASAARRRQIKTALGAIGLASLGIVLTSIIVARLAAKPDQGQIGLADSATVFVVLALLCCLGTVASDERLRRLSAWLLLPLLAVDVGIQLEPIHRIVQRVPQLSRDADLERFPATIKSGRLANDSHFAHRIGARKQVREFFGRRTALTSKRYQTYSTLATKSYHLLAAAGVQFYAGKHAQLMLRLGPDGVKRVSGNLLELEKRVPSVFWHGAPQVVKSAAEALKIMRARGPKAVAVAERQDLNVAQRRAVEAMDTGSPVVPGRIRSLRRNTLRLTVDAPAAGMLVVNEKYSKGWKAWADGKPARLFRANYLFRGLLVGPGHHDVEMRFEPRAVRLALVGYGVTLATLLGLLLFGIVAGVRRRMRLREGSRTS